MRRATHRDAVGADFGVGFLLCRLSFNPVGEKMARTPLQVVEGEQCAPVAPLLPGLPTDGRRERLTRLVVATESALAELSTSTSTQFAALANELAAFRERLRAELATLQAGPQGSA